MPAEIKDIVREARGTEVAKPLIDRVNELAANARAKNTIRAVRSDWAHFSKWCAQNNVSALPADPGTMALYIAALGDQASISTVRRRLVSVGQAHTLGGYQSPTKDGRVREILKGLVRERGSATKSKTALGTNELRAMLAALPTTTIGIRDRALLLLGFLGAFRRSELASLTVDDLEFIPEDGLAVCIQRSKTDQEAVGRLVGVPYGKSPETCAVIATQSWLDAAKISNGPLFRAVDRHGNVGRDAMSDKAVALIVKRRVAAVGLDPTRFAGHSLRSGFCTAAGAKDVPERLIMLQTGHRSTQTVRRYIRQGSLFSQNAAKALDL